MWLWSYQWIGDRSVERSGLETGSCGSRAVAPCGRRVGDNPECENLGGMDGISAIPPICHHLGNSSTSAIHRPSSSTSVSKSFVSWMPGISCLQSVSTIISISTVMLRGRAAMPTAERA